MALATLDDFLATKFDYLIIGGGAAGLVLAGRLSEDSDVTVGVLEAGADQSKNPLVQIPGLGTGTAGNPELDWSFTTVPQKGTFDRVHRWPRGKGLGGSAMMNTMMWSNASKRDLDSWGRLGNEGWDWDSMQPYYRKVERYNAPDTELAKVVGPEYIDPSMRGTNGPIETSFCTSLSGWFEEDWRAAALNAGYPIPDEPRKGISLGAFNQLMTIDPKTKTRSYSYSGYIEPHLGRSNLKVLTNARAGKVILAKEGDDVVAKGVQFYIDGTEYKANAAREVICAAGSIQTPQILELSGIGNHALLQKHGIETFVDNKYVGENLQDHPLVGLTYQVNDDVPTGEAMTRNPEIGAQVMEAYMKDKAGPMTGGLTGVGFSSLHMVAPDLSDSQVDELVDKAGEFQSTATRKQLEIQEEQLRDKNEALIQWITIAAGVDFREVDDDVSKAFGHSIPGGWASMAAVATHLFSRGSVHIGSSDPQVYPVIDPNYMSHPLDADIMGRSILHCRQLMRTDPLASKFKRGADGDLIPMPAHHGGIHDPKTLDDAKEFVKRNCITCYHPIGTASMLPREEGGVVDADLKVYGTKNLRVIDASVFPLHVQGNIMSLVYAIAEKGADIIKTARG